MKYKVRVEIIVEANNQKEAYEKARQGIKPDTGFFLLDVVPGLQRERNYD